MIGGRWWWCVTVYVSVDSVDDVDYDRSWRGFGAWAMSCEPVYLLVVHDID